MTDMLELSENHLQMFVIKMFQYAIISVLETNKKNESFIKELEMFNKEIEHINKYQIEI